jgi:hypothetical protein
MIVRILVIILVCTLVIFIGYWIFTGGISRAIGFARTIDNPLNYFLSSTTGMALRLPGQPDTSNFGVDISQYMDSVPGSSYGPGGGTQGSQQDQLNELQNRYDALYAQANDAKNFGTPSPYRDKVIFDFGNAQGSTPDSEYLSLRADYANSAPISLAGWSLQSAVTGLRAPLPLAAPTFILGILNTAASVSLDPGATAIVASGPSPVGTSFRENICSGYLAELQTFTPNLDRVCPMGEKELPLNAQNIQSYGDACIDIAKNLPQCHFPGLDGPLNVSPACNTALLNKLSYNGCVYGHRLDRNFASNVWRLYLTSGVQLWRDTHDIVRLLDDQGRTVDVLTY